MCCVLFYVCASQIGLCTEVKPRIDFGTLCIFCESSGQGFCNDSIAFSKRSIFLTPPSPSRFCAKERSDLDALSPCSRREGVGGLRDGYAKRSFRECVCVCVCVRVQT